MGRATFDLTIKWTSRTSPWFLGTFRAELYAASAGVEFDHAISMILVGMIWSVDGFDANTLLDTLRPAGPAPATDCADQIALLMQGSEVDFKHLTIALEFLAHARDPLRPRLSQR